MFVLAPISRLLFALLTIINNAMSMANAMSVRSAARKDMMLDISVTVMWVEKESRNATKMAAVAAR